MTEQLPGMENEKRDVVLSQWFTPPELAERIVDFALEPYDYRGDLRVLEPSAGRGALAFALRDRVRRVTCCDIDARHVEYLINQGFGSWRRDFLELPPSPFDIVVMNPPYENGQAEAHILHALKFAPRVVAHVPLTTLEGKKRREGLWSEAYLKRLAICSSRPKYGAKAGATAMCTIEVVRRPEGKQAMDGRVAFSGVDVEMWP